MWQNLIINLARNPAALRALFDLVAPAVRRESALAIEKLHAELAEVARSQEQQNALVRVELERLREEAAAAARGQEERIAALEAEINRTRAEMNGLVRAARRGERELPADAPVRKWWWR